MGLFKDYVSQTRKPEGFLGKMMLRGMNSGHARMADWGLSHLRRVDPGLHRVPHRGTVPVSRSCASTE